MRRSLLCGLAAALIMAAPAEAAYLDMSEAKQLVRKGARRYVETFDAYGYRIRCGRQSRTKILCRVRILGYDGGAYNCNLYVEVVLRRGVLESRLVESFC